MSTFSITQSTQDPDEPDFIILYLFCTLLCRPHAQVVDIISSMHSMHRRDEKQANQNT